jgi:hypothetical protein
MKLAKTKAKPLFLSTPLNNTPCRKAAAGLARPARNLMRPLKRKGSVANFGAEQEFAESVVSGNSAPQSEFSSAMRWMRLRISSPILGRPPRG